MYSSYDKYWSIFQLEDELWLIINSNLCDSNDNPFNSGLKSDCGALWSN